VNSLPEYPETKHVRQDQEALDRRRQAIKEFKQGRAILRAAQRHERDALRRKGLTGWARVNAFRQMQCRHSHDFEELEAQFRYVQKAEGVCSNADTSTWLSGFRAQATERLLLFVVVIGVVDRKVLRNEVSSEQARAEESLRQLFKGSAQGVSQGLGEPGV
jgi:hypothetical protein